MGDRRGPRGRHAPLRRARRGDRRPVPRRAALRRGRRRHTESHSVRAVQLLAQGVSVPPAAALRLRALRRDRRLRMDRSRAVARSLVLRPAQPAAARGLAVDRLARAALRALAMGTAGGRRGVPALLVEPGGDPEQPDPGVSGPDRDAARRGRRRELPRAATDRRLLLRRGGDDAQAARRARGAAARVARTARVSAATKSGVVGGRRRDRRARLRAVPLGGADALGAARHLDHPSHVARPEPAGDESVVGGAVSRQCARGDDVVA